MRYTLKCFAVTHIGSRRRKNEDSFFIGELLTMSEQAAMEQSYNKSIAKTFVTDNSACRIFAVSDGMGGHKYGEVASSITMEALKNLSDKLKEKQRFDTAILKNVTRSTQPAETDKDTIIEMLQQTIQEANRQINNYSARMDALNDIGATLSGLMTFNNEAQVFNIGDSLVMLFEGGALRKLTKDDNELVKFEGIDPNSLPNNGKRLTKYLGLPESDGILSATLSQPLQMNAGQIYIMATDGLSDNVPLDTIEEIMVRYSSENLETTIYALIDLALESKSGGNDNITIAGLLIT